MRYSQVYNWLSSLKFSSPFQTLKKTFCNTSFASSCSITMRRTCQYNFSWYFFIMLVKAFSLVIGLRNSVKNSVSLVVEDILGLISLDYWLFKWVCFYALIF